MEFLHSLQQIKQEPQDCGVRISGLERSMAEAVVSAGVGASKRVADVERPATRSRTKLLKLELPAPSPLRQSKKNEKKLTSTRKEILKQFLEENPNNRGTDHWINAAVKFLKEKNSTSGRNVDSIDMKRWLTKLLEKKENCQVAPSPAVPRLPAVTVPTLEGPFTPVNLSKGTARQSGTAPLPTANLTTASLPGEISSAVSVQTPPSNAPLPAVPFSASKVQAASLPPTSLPATLLWTPGAQTVPLPTASLPEDILSAASVQAPTLPTASLPEMVLSTPKVQTEVFSKQPRRPLAPRSPVQRPSTPWPSVQRPYTLWPPVQPELPLFLSQESVTKSPSQGFLRPWLRTPVASMVKSEVPVKNEPAEIYSLQMPLVSGAGVELPSAYDATVPKFELETTVTQSGFGNIHPDAEGDNRPISTVTNDSWNTGNSVNSCPPGTSSFLVTEDKFERSLNVNPFFKIESATKSDQEPQNPTDVSLKVQYSSFTFQIPPTSYPLTVRVEPASYRVTHYRTPGSNANDIKPIVVPYCPTRQTQTTKVSGETEDTMIIAVSSAATTSPEITFSKLTPD